MLAGVRSVVPDSNVDFGASFVRLAGVIDDMTGARIGAEIDIFIPASKSTDLDRRRSVLESFLRNLLGEVDRIRRIGSADSSLGASRSTIEPT